MNGFITTYMPEWNGILQFIYIAALLLVAKVVKEKVPVINKVIVPSALVAGFIGWIISDNLLGLFTVDVDLLQVVMYNAMGLGFIALALKTGKESTELRPLTTGAIIASGYLFQAILGTIIVVLFFSSYFNGTGFLVALGFSQGPSLASSIGSGWEFDIAGNPYLLPYGRALGVAIAVIGFLWGGIAGVIINNYHARKNNLEILHVKHEIVSTDIHIESHSKVTFFDALTSQVVLVLLVYGGVFIILSGTSYFLPKLGDLGSTFAGLFYGLNFLIGIFLAFGFKAIQKRFKFRGKDLRFMTNDYLLQSISSFMFNIMITASVLIVSSASVKEYLPFILVATTVAGICTYFYFRTLVRWQFDAHHHDYTIGLYGNGTGTISTGIALVKMLDPNLEKPVVQDLVMGSGTALFFAIPLFGILALPESGASVPMIFLALFGYFVILMSGLAIAKRRRKKNG